VLVEVGQRDFTSGADCVADTAGLALPAQDRLRVIFLKVSDMHFDAGAGTDSCTSSAYGAEASINYILT
jgi:hypothetical protein